MKLLLSKLFKEDNAWNVVGGLNKTLSGLLTKGRFNPRFYLYRYKFRINPLRHKVSDFPIDVMVESTNQCNLKCIMCYHADPDIPFQQDGRAKYMGMDLFKKVVDECAENGIYSMKLSFRGEPFMNKRFPDMIRYAKSKNIMEVSTLTNATLLNAELAKNVIDSGLDQLIISMDGLTKETYEKIRVKSNYDVVMENVHRFIELRGGEKKKPFIRIQYTEVPENRHETADFYNYWKDKVNEVSISYFYEFDSPEKARKMNKEIPVYENFSCEQLWQRIVVLCDGRVSLCGSDVIPETVVGDAKVQSIRDIWHSKKMKNIRKLHQEGNYYKIPMCKVCVHNQKESVKFRNNTLFPN